MLPLTFQAQASDANPGVSLFLSPNVGLNADPSYWLDGVLFESRLDHLFGWLDGVLLETRLDRRRIDGEPFIIDWLEKREQTAGTMNISSGKRSCIICSEYLVHSYDLLSFTKPLNYLLLGNAVH